ncbi:MAG TPA: SPASM domain-containing protein [Desulfosarcina sp.]|nr:SPASM domain-containing protein [Desulfosarcina sp.]
MLNATVTKGHSPRLNIGFDIPVPSAVQAHPEWVGAWEALRGLKGAEVQMAGDAIAGFSVDTAGLRSIAGTLRPEDRRFHEAVFESLSESCGSDSGDGLQVNFHQRPFDTDTRHWNFILNQGHFFDYLLNRIYWYLGPKRGIVTPFPLHVDLETANTCNMNCPMCYRDQMKEVGQMELGLFQKAVDECARYRVFSLRLSWRGEPLTHPRIKEMVAYATARIKNVSFLTNAFYLDEAIVDCLIDHQVAYIAVSFDGIGRVYESVRHPAKYADSRDRLRRLISRRRQAGSLRPQVRLCTVWPAVKDDPQAYAAAMGPVSDYMVANPYINFSGPMTLKPDFICQYPWERIMVGFNGKVQCCTGWNADDIILGNLADSSITELWKSARMARIRRLHASGRRMQLNSCARCRHGSKGDPAVDIADILARRH